MAITFTRPKTTARFLWNVSKDQVYNLKQKTIPALKNAISDKFIEVAFEMCQKFCRGIGGRVQN